MVKSQIIHNNRNSKVDYHKMSNKERKQKYFKDISVYDTSGNFLNENKLVIPYLVKDKQLKPLKRLKHHLPRKMRTPRI